MSHEKTHYRKAFDSPYLSAADIVEPVRLTIARVRLEGDKTKKTRSQMNTAYFVEHEIRRGEKLKPMILNATNSKTMANITGSPFLDDWMNVPIEVYVDNKVRFGNEIVDGLRIRKVADIPLFDFASTLSAITDAPNYESARKIGRSVWGQANTEQQDKITAAIRNRHDAPDKKAEKQ